MAPDSPNHKRKRGRPPGASKPEEDASRQGARKQRREGATTEQPPEPEDRPAEQERPRKPGRKARGPGPAAQAEPEPEAEAAPRRPRGRPRGGAPAQASEAEPATVEDLTVKKRGRGRPSLSKGTEAVPNVDEAPAKSESRAKGRVRPPKGAAAEKGPATESIRESGASGEPPQNQAERAEAGPRRSHRERRSWDAEQLFSAKISKPQDEGAKASAAKKRKRAAAEEQPEEEMNEEDSGRRRSNRERRSRDTKEVSSVNMPNLEEAETTGRAGPSKQKRGRGATSDKGSSSKEQNQGDASAAEPPKKRRRGRPSPETEAPEEPVQPRRRGRLSKQNEEQVAPSNETAEPRRRGRPRTSLASTEEEAQQSDAPARRRRKGSPDTDQQPDKNAEKSKSRKRRSGQPQPTGDDEEGDEDASAGTVAPGRLTGVSQRVSLSTIESKWAPLDSASVDVVADIVADAQRTVLLQFRRSERQGNAAAEALGMMSRRLLAKLKKGQPFPPPTLSASARRAAGASHENDFHFERTVDASQALEDTLDPLLHSIALLEREKKKEEAALERDYAALRTLDANARAEMRSWREHARKSHVLAPEMKLKEEPESEGGSHLQLVQGDKDGVGNAFKDLEDEELISLSRQIGSHMESMKSNLQQVDGVVPAIIKSKAALQGVLSQHLDPQQYSKVLLG